MSPAMPAIPKVPMPAFPAAGKEKLAREAALWAAAWGPKAELGALACAAGGILLFLLGLRSGSRPAAKAGLGLAFLGAAAVIASRVFVGVIVGGR